MKRDNPRLVYLPVVIISGVIPALTLPMMMTSHLPDYVKGLAMGIPIGIALVGLILMVRGVTQAS